MRKLDMEKLEVLKKSFKNIGDYLGEDDQPKSEEAEYVLNELCIYLDEAEIYYDGVSGEEEIWGIYEVEELILEDLIDIILEV